MLYFCVNNNYHLLFERQILNFLKGEKTLLQVPFSLDLLDVVGFDNIIKLSYDNSISLKRLILKFCEVKHMISEISSRLSINDSDTLFIHTDINLVNAIIIELFAKSRAKIILLEDGTATMSDYNLKSRKLKPLDVFRSHILQYVYGLRKTNLVDFECDKHLRVKDLLFSKLIVSWGNNTLRNIPILNVGIGDISVREFTTGAIFFNQPMYLFLCSQQEYLYILSQVLELSKKITPFYFKFHPHDTQLMRDQMQRLIDREFPLVNMINEEIPAEIIVDRYNIKYSISYTSTCTLNHIKKGLIPIFLVDIFNQFKSSKQNEIFELFLDQIGCDYPNQLNEIDNDYNSLRNFCENSIVRKSIDKNTFSDLVFSN